MAGILWGTFATASALANNSLSPAEKKAGWILLFDGIDKDAHWRQSETGSDDAKNLWTLVDSSMKTVNAYSFLCTKSTEQFSDLEFSAEWKMDKGGNSGLFIRVLTSTYNDGYEYAILDDENGGDKTARSRNPLDKLPSGQEAYIKRTGAIYDMYPTTKDGQVGGQYYDSTVSKPYDQWNHGVIWANGNSIEHWLNGKKVVVAEIGSPEWEARFVNSKWHGNPNVPQTTWAKHPKGSLCLQAHGGGELSYFRNLKVRPFTPGETLVSPSVFPEGGSFTTTVKVGLEVAITGAVIHYTLDGSEPTENSPVYQDSILLNATTTLKAKTSRARFQSSATTVATFTKGTSSIRGEDLSPEPRVSFTRMNGGFLIRNENAGAFKALVFDLSGSKASVYSVDEGMQAMPVTGLKHGIYLVKLQRGGWSRLHKVAVD